MLQLDDQRRIVLVELREMYVAEQPTQFSGQFHPSSNGRHPPLILPSPLELQLARVGEPVALAVDVAADRSAG